MKQYKFKEKAKNLKESKIPDLVIWPGNSAKDFGKDYDQLYDLSYNGPMISPKDEMTPSAWDAGFEIKGNNFIIQGGVDSNGFGNVEITLPKKSVKDYYEILIQPRSQEDYDAITEILSKYGWIFKEY